MTTYTWPTTRVFTAASAEWRLAPNVFSLPSQFSGHTQTVELPGARWMVRVTFTPHNNADRAAVEAFLAKVRGKANRIALWHPKRPVPLGTMRGSPVLAATEPRGETSLAIADALGTNLLKYTQEFDNAYWLKNRASVTANAVVAPDGTVTADKLIEDTTAANSHAIYSNNMSITAGDSIALSVYAKAAERTGIRLVLQEDVLFVNYVQAAFDLSAGTVGTAQAGGDASSPYASIESVGGGWYRCSVSGVISPTATKIDALFAMLSSGSVSYDGDGASGIYIWGAQFERASRASAYDPFATLKAGDMIKVGDTLLMVTDDATADGAGAITVSVTPGLKAQVSSGTAVTWDRPTATFILDEAPWVPHTAVYSPSFSISLTEA